MWRVITGLALLLTACSGPASPPPAQPAQPAVAFGTDMAWAQLTVALNQRALQYLYLVPDRAADARLVNLAHDLADSHTLENVQLNALLRQIGAPLDNPHTDHDMPGMATAERIASMSAARGEAFDTLFASSLREHLTQCQTLAHSMRQAGQLPDALTLATTIESGREQALTRLAPWSG